jgi:5,10-methylenetetrahydromethanopterin reductase
MESPMTRVVVNMPALRLSEIPDVARAAEDAGFDGLRIGDTFATAREVYCALTMIAASSNRLTLGPGVTNPVVRHPSVTASAIASVDELSGGRAVLGMSVGDSAVHNLGGKPATVSELEESIRAIQSLHETGRAVYHGNELVLEWWSGRRIPVVVAAHGPRTLRLAGRIADGVVVGLGMSDDARAYVHEHLAAGAESAGHSVDDIEVWYLCYTNLGESAAEAVTAAGSALAVAGNILRQSQAIEFVPGRLRAAFDELGERYSYVHHGGSASGNPNGALLKELGLEEYLAEAFGVFGTPEDARGRLVELEGRGISNLWAGYVQPDFTSFFERWGRDVMRRG